MGLWATQKHDNPTKKDCKNETTLSNHRACFYAVHGLLSRTLRRHRHPRSSSSKKQPPGSNCKKKHTPTATAKTKQQKTQKTLTLPCSNRKNNIPRQQQQRTNTPPLPQQKQKREPPLAATAKTPRGRKVKATAPPKKKAPPPRQQQQKNNTPRQQQQKTKHHPATTASNKNIFTSSLSNKSPGLRELSAPCLARLCWSAASLQSGEAHEDLRRLLHAAMELAEGRQEGSMYRGLTKLGWAFCF